MRVLFPRIIVLLLCLTLSACVYVIPATQSLVNSSNAVDAPLSLKQARDIESIGTMYGAIYWAFTVNAPLGEQPMKARLTFFDQAAEGAKLNIRLVDIQQIQMPAEFEKLIKETEKTFASQNPRALWLFSYNFHTEVVVSLTYVIQSLTDTKQLAEWSRFIGMHMALAANAAEKLGVDTAAVKHGNQIANLFLGGLADSNPATVQTEVLLWQGETGDLPYLAADQPTPEPTPTRQGMVGIDITQQLPPGDSKRGEDLMIKQGCAGCHKVEQRAVAQPFSASGAEDGLSMVQRAKVIIQSEKYKGSAKSAEEYLFESVVLPNIYVADGYPKSVHPANYSNTLDKQDMADMIAYMMTFQ